MTTNNTYYISTLSISSIFAFRMLGLFMLLPVFSTYADELAGATHALMGLGFGIYGLTQALCQIPLGHLSDKIGRKPVIIIGLLLFALGSIICGQAHSIHTLILGRAIQGAGAIGSTLIALIADLTTTEQRTKSMALLGMIIGTSFTVAVVIGPIIARLFGFHGIFHCMTLLALLGILMTLFIIPTPAKETFHPDVSASRALFSEVLKNQHINYLNISIFCQHLIFAALFYAVPILLESHLKVYWHFYLPIMVLSFIFAVPLIIIGEKKKKFKQIFLLAIALVLISQILLIEQHSTLRSIGFALFIYFISFNALEASLPSSITKAVAANAKGTAMGIYSMSQFMGFFVGGTLAGHVYGLYQLNGIFSSISIIALFWLIISTFMPKFNLVQNRAEQPYKGELNG